MAPYIKVLVPLAAYAIGFWALFAWWFWPGLIALLAAFLIGSWWGTYLFKRYATPDQIKEDLRARLHND